MEFELLYRRYTEQVIVGRDSNRDGSSIHSGPYKSDQSNTCLALTESLAYGDSSYDRDSFVDGLGRSPALDGDDDAQASISRKRPLNDSNDVHEPTNSSDGDELPLPSDDNERERESGERDLLSDADSALTAISKRTTRKDTVTSEQEIDKDAKSATESNESSSSTSDSDEDYDESTEVISRRKTAKESSPNYKRIIKHTPQSGGAKRTSSPFKSGDRLRNSTTKQNQAEESKAKKTTGSVGTGAKRRRVAPRIIQSPIVNELLRSATNGDDIDSTEEQIQSGSPGPLRLEPARLPTPLRRPILPAGTNILPTLQHNAGSPSPRPKALWQRRRTSTTQTASPALVQKSARQAPGSGKLNGRMNTQTDGESSVSMPMRSPDFGSTIRDFAESESAADDWSVSANHSKESRSASLAWNYGARKGPIATASPAPSGWLTNIKD